MDGSIGHRFSFSPSKGFEYIQFDVVKNYDGR
jgi:hypothetical protein